MADLADVIFNNKDLDLYTKIIRLWVLAQLSGYKTDFGRKCYRQIGELTNSDIATAIGFITGFAYTGIKKDILKGLIPELKGRN